MIVMVIENVYLLFFFFSSRRRHTRSLCDWSSDVCSSDLLGQSAWNLLRGGGLHYPALGYSNAGGRPRWAPPPVPRRASGLGRPQRNCPCEIGRASCRERV